MQTKNQLEKYVQSFLILLGTGVCFYLIFKLFHEPIEKKSSTGFLFFEMILGMVLIFVPNLFKKFFKIEIPSFIAVFYWLFLALAVFIGTGLQVIARIFYWDKILHLGSSMLLVAVGYGLLSFFLDGKLTEPLTPFFYILFGLSFGLMCGVVWEFYEFICDSLLGMNLQRFAGNGHDLLGRAALMDTMGDLWINALGAVLFSIPCYIKGKKDPGFFQKLAFKKTKKTTERS